MTLKSGTVKIRSYKQHTRKYIINYSCPLVVNVKLKITRLHNNKKKVNQILIERLNQNEYLD